MPTFKITLAYDGTDYVGWQRQTNGTSIQELLEDALGELDGRRVVVTGAGRTDAGVHALGQVAGCSLDRSITGAAVARAVNARLPADIRVLSAVEVPPQFHARFHARAKTYRYRIWNADVVSPFERRYVWHVESPLDVAMMDVAARLLEGHHDFAAFRAAGGATRTSVRTMTTSRVDRRDRLIVFEITGNGFLRYMVRAIVGTLVEVGRGRQKSAWMGDVLAACDRARAGPTAPPEGLFLVRVDYESRTLSGPAH